jgi:hypothetical protein
MHGPYKTTDDGREYGWCDRWGGFCQKMDLCSEWLKQYTEENAREEEGSL